MTLNVNDQNSFRTLQEKILDWADEKNLLSNTSLQPQASKVLEEATETFEACLALDEYFTSDDVIDEDIFKDKKTEIIDGIGDGFVTLIILAEQLGVDPMECLEYVYGVIAPRTGKTINGVFVKDA